MQDKNESQLIFGGAAAALSNQTAKKARVEYFIDQATFPGGRLRCNQSPSGFDRLARSALPVVGASALIASAVCHADRSGGISRSDGAQTARDLIRSLPVRSAFGLPVYVAASPSA